MKKFFKIFLISLLVILCVFGLIVGGLNLFKHAIYSDYYNIKTDLVNNAGLGDGYVPQGVTKITKNDKDIYFTSGYMDNNSPSRIYVITENDYSYVTVKVDSTTYSKGHFGGIASNDKYLFISTESKVLIIEIDDVLNVAFPKKGKKDIEKTVTVVSSFDVGVEASYIYVDEQNKYLYVGEFFGHEYETDPTHTTLVNDGKDTYHSYVSCYSITNIFSNSENKPLYHYVVRDLVQGFAISDDKIVLSTSYGLASSYFYVYDIPKDIDDKENKLYHLDDRYLTNTIKAPAMAEGLDFDGEQFITLYESATNKYFFGKLFFANKIVGLKI